MVEEKHSTLLAADLLPSIDVERIIVSITEMDVRMSGFDKMGGLRRTSKSKDGGKDVLTWDGILDGINSGVSLHQPRSRQFGLPPTH